MNASGNFGKRRITAADIMPKFGDEAPPKPFDAEKRRREFEESAKLHKQKFWKLINGRSLEDIKIPDFSGEGTENKNAEDDGRAARIMEIISPNKDKQ